MRTIFLGFSKRKGFAPLSVLIRAVEGVDFSHTFIEINSKDKDLDFIYHASGSQVNFNGKELFLEKNQVIKKYAIDISEYKYKNLLKFCVKNSGKPYSLAQLFGLGLVSLCNLFGLKLKNPISESGFICTELVIEALNATEFNFLTKIDSNSIGLRDLEHLIKTMSLQSK